MQDFRSLKVWQKSHEATLIVYRVTETYPQTEMYGLTNQMRRAAVSIPSNIAEGAGRGSRREFAQFLRNASGSASELEYQVLLSRDLGYAASEACADLTERLQEVRRMLAGLISTLTEADNQ